MAFKQEVNIPLIFTTGVVSVTLLMVLILGTEAWYDSQSQAEAAAKYQEFPNHTLIDLKASQRENIAARPQWVDRDHKVVSIPIDQAEAVMIQTQGKFPSTQP